MGKTWAKLLTIPLMLVVASEASIRTGSWLTLSEYIWLTILWYRKLPDWMFITSCQEIAKAIKINENGKEIPINLTRVFYFYTGKQCTYKKHGGECSGLIFIKPCKYTTQTRYINFFLIYFIYTSKSLHRKKPVTNMIIIVVGTRRKKRVEEMIYVQSVTVRSEMLWSDDWRYWLFGRTSTYHQKDSA